MVVLITLIQTIKMLGALRRGYYMQRFVAYTTALDLQSAYILL
jgi:hypothetical protein